MRLTMFDPDRPMITSNPTAPDASFATASSAELYVATWIFVPVSFWNFLSVAGSA